MTTFEMRSSQNVEVAGIFAAISAFAWFFDQIVAPTTRAMSGAFCDAPWDMSVLASASVGSAVGSASICPRA